MIFHSVCYFFSFRLTRLGTGIIKRFLPIDDEHKTIFSFYERGKQVKGKPSIVFIHGFSGEKETWLNVVKVSTKKTSLIFKYYFIFFLSFRTFLEVIIVL